MLSRKLPLSTLAFLLLVGGCSGKQAHDGFFLLRWIEKPRNRGIWEETPTADRCEFSKCGSFNRQNGSVSFGEVRGHLQEGDVVACWLSVDEVNKELLKGKVNTAIYGAVKYGHLGILVKDPKNPERLVLFSSEGFKGPNVDEDLDDLKEHSFDAFRLDKTARLNAERLREFVVLSIEKAGKWNGYDFSGMFGLWNGDLKPSRPEDIDNEYICSTVVVAALYYSGVELEASHRRGLLDSVTPFQVVSSKGRFVRLPQMHVEAVALEQEDLDGHEATE